MAKHTRTMDQLTKLVRASIRQQVKCEGVTEFSIDAHDRNGRGHNWSVSYLPTAPTECQAAAAAVIGMLADAYDLEG